MRLYACHVSLQPKIVMEPSGQPDEFPVKLLSASILFAIWERESARGDTAGRASRRACVGIGRVASRARFRQQRRTFCPVLEQHVSPFEDRKPWPVKTQF